MDTERHFLFLLTGSRRNGNSELLARHAARSLPASARQTWLSLLDLPLAPFADARHESDGVYPAPEGAGGSLLEATLAATDLVLVAPLYWYAVPTPAKLYLDHWSGWMRVPGVNFLDRMAGKTLWSVTALSDGDHSVAEPLIATLRLTAAYMKMGFGGCLLGYGNRPGEVLADDEALARAERFFLPEELVAAATVA